MLEGHGGGTDVTDATGASRTPALHFPDPIQRPRFTKHGLPYMEGDLCCIYPYGFLESTKLVGAPAVGVARERASVQIG